MKKVLLIIGLLVIAVFAKAQKVEHIEVKGKKYAVIKDFPAEILGKYIYEKGEKTEEPIVFLGKDGKGQFQPHMIPPIDINFWLVCDEDGKPMMIKGSEQRYGYTLVTQYKNSTNGNYPSDSYDLMGVNVLHDIGWAVIYGERYKRL